jgi:hypothetical protein
LTGPNTFNLFGAFISYEKTKSFMNTATGEEDPRHEQAETKAGVYSGRRGRSGIH